MTKPVLKYRVHHSVTYVLTRLARRLHLWSRTRALEFTHCFLSVRVVQSLVFCILICRLLFELLSPFLGQFIVCPSSTYGFWLYPVLSSNLSCVKWFTGKRILPLTFILDKPFYQNENTSNCVNYNHNIIQNKSNSPTCPSDNWNSFFDVIVPLMRALTDYMKVLIL